MGQRRRLASCMRERWTDAGKREIVVSNDVLIALPPVSSYRVARGDQFRETPLSFSSRRNPVIDGYIPRVCVFSLFPGYV